MGKSVIVKDNLVFGIKERRERFIENKGGEEKLLSREGRQNKDVRCEMWIQFENGTRVLVEMQDKQNLNLQEIPPSEPVQELEEGVDATSQPDELNHSVEGSVDKNKHMIIQDGSKLDVGQKSQMSRNASQKSIGTKSQGSVDNRSQKTAQKSVASRKSGNVPPEQQDNWDPYSGAKLTFTFKQGLTVCILPNGDVLQKLIKNPESTHHKFGGALHNTEAAALIELHRVITRKGHVIRYMQDENMQILYADGTVTYTDNKKGNWATINNKGVRRVRKQGDVHDHKVRIELQEKIDPETNSIIKVRKDGVLIVEYEDGSKLVKHHDGTQILT